MTASTTFSDFARRGYRPRAIARRTKIPRTTVRGWLAGEVPRGRRRTGACPRCGRAAHAFAELPPSYVYLLGLYLGDGYIAAHRRAVYKLRITLDAKYPKVIDQCVESMRELVPTRRVSTLKRRYGDVEVYSYGKCWPCLFPQHGPGQKHNRTIALEDWQTALVTRHPELLVRGLIHSDGCRFENTGRNWRNPRYCFSNLSQDIRAIFCETCELLGLHWTSSRTTVYVSRKADVQRLDALGAAKS